MQIVNWELLVESSAGVLQGQELARRHPFIVEDDEVRAILLEGPSNPRYFEEMRFLVKSYRDGDSYLEYDEECNLLKLEPDIIQQGMLERMAVEGNTAAANLLDQNGWMTFQSFVKYLDEYVEIRKMIK